VTDQLQRIRRRSTATLIFGCIGLASAAGAGVTAMLLAAPYGDWVYPGFWQRIGLVAVLASIGVLVGLAGGLLLLAGIRLFRQYFPKQSDLSKHSQADLNKVALRFNQCPRNKLQYLSQRRNFAKVFK
jgi:hypothetical protein